jgi:hypothetical protein
MLEHHYAIDKSLRELERLNTLPLFSIEYTYHTGMLGLRQSEQISCAHALALLLSLEISGILPLLQQEVSSIL